MTDANGNTWVPVQVIPEKQGFDDDGFTPVSKKVTGPSASSSSSSGGPPSDVWDGSTSSSSSGYVPPPPGESWPMANDIDMPDLAKVCADREAAKGSYTFVPADGSVPADAHVSITRDLTEHRYGDGLYRTTFTVMFRDAKKYDDAEHGRTRAESLSWLNVHLDSEVSHPNAFSIGAPQEVAIGWGAGDDRFSCSLDGLASEWSNGERLPYEKGIVTLTRRDATGIGGTIDVGARKLTFDAPFGESYPGEDGICCLR